MLDGSRVTENTRNFFDLRQRKKGSLWNIKLDIFFTLMLVSLNQLDYIK